MCVDVVLKIDQDTQEYIILGISARLYTAVMRYGSVLVDQAGTDQPYEIYKDGDSLKAQPVSIHS
jgi:hypothetical protein